MADMANLHLARLRADTPGIANRIHLNNAGASLMPQPVLDAVQGYLELEAAIGGYEAADARADDIRTAYAEVEGLIGAAPGTVAFCESTTVAFQQALGSIPFRSGDRILTTRQDYASNHLMYLALRERFGVEIEHAPESPEGGVDAMGAVEALHRRRPRLVAMSHIPTSSPVVQDLAVVGRACRERSIPFLVDACQSVGQTALDVEHLPCTFLAASARKFLRGPRGCGFLYVDPAALEDGIGPMLPDLRGADWIDAELAQPAPDARRFETWEFQWGLVLGTAQAARYARTVGLEAIRDRAWGLADRLRKRLAEVPRVRVLDRGRSLSAIVTVAVEGVPASRLVRTLRERGINTSAVEHTSAVLDFTARGIESALRLSPHYFNAEDELESAAEALEELLGE